MVGLFIDVGVPSGAQGYVYGCDWCYNLKDYHYLFNTLSSTMYDKYVIHFDGLYMDILEEMVAKGMNTSKYEVRIHSVNKEQYNRFWDYVNEHWTDQTGWFNRERKLKECLL